MYALRRLAPVALLAAVSGCELIPTARICPMIPSFPGEVEVRDAQTGAPAAFGAQGMAVSDTYSDSLRTEGVGYLSPDSMLLMRLHGGPGIYSVTIQKPGYSIWKRDGVVVRRAECGLQTQELRADLQRAP